MLQTQHERDLLAPINLLDRDYVEDISGPHLKGKRVSLSEYGHKTQLLTQGRDKNPIVPGVADYIQAWQYDRYLATAGTALPAQFSWFVTPYNQGGKTQADTNLQLSSQLPQPQWMNVIGLSIYVASTMQKPDIDAWFNSYWIEFWVDQKIYSQGPPWAYPASGGMQGYWTQATAADRSYYNNGAPEAYNFFDLRLPQGIDLGGVTTDGATGILINQGQTFHVDSKGISFTLASADGTYGGFNAMCVLSGILSRAVQ